jgi:hypothetical protein
MTARSPLGVRSAGVVLSPAEAGLGYGNVREDPRLKPGATVLIVGCLPELSCAMTADLIIGLFAGTFVRDDCGSHHRLFAGTSCAMTADLFIGCLPELRAR